jgi:glycosyltransferase involved in cell wall biosynthesis
MRILFYVDTGGSTGGPGMHSVRIWRAFRERWPELTGPIVIPTSETDRKIFAAQVGDENVREIATSTLMDPGADPVVVRTDFFAELSRLARAEGCDHIHILWGFLVPEQVEAVPSRERLPVTITLCDATGRAEANDVDAMYFGSDRWDRYLRDALRVPCGYLAISDRTRSDALAKGVDPAHVETVHLWIDPTLQAQGTDEHEPYVAYVGGLAEYKGVGHILDFALAYPEYPIKVTGYPSDDFPIDWARYPSVEYLGYVAYAEVVRLMSRARALLYISYSEGFGLPMLEAQTLGVPLIVNPRNMMVGELLARGSYVAAANVASPTSIKAAIDVATRDRRELVANGKTNAARFQEDRQVRRMREAIEREHARLADLGGWGR